MLARTVRRLLCRTSVPATLIYGVRDAVLMDAFMTVKQANALADWVATSICIWMISWATIHVATKS